MNPIKICIFKFHLNTTWISFGSLLNLIKNHFWITFESNQNQIWILSKFLIPIWILFESLLYPFWNSFVFRLNQFSISSMSQFEYDLNHFCISFLYCRRPVQYPLGKCAQKTAKFRQRHFYYLCGYAMEIHIFGFWIQFFHQLVDIYLFIYDSRLLSRRYGGLDTWKLYF